MTVQELSQLHHLRCEVEEDMGRLEALRARTAASPQYTGMPPAPRDGDALARQVAEIVDLERIIKDKMARCVRERIRLEQFIADIPDSLTRRIFKMRFADGLSWVQVAHRLGNNTEQSVKMTCYRYLKCTQA